MLLVIEVRPAHYKWRLGNIGRSINDRCQPVSAGPSKMGYFQDRWSHVQWRNLLKKLFNQETQQHDEEPTVAGSRKDNYFVAPSFYCVETICAPCGVVIAWTKFAKAASPTNILNFLNVV